MRRVMVACGALFACAGAMAQSTDENARLRAEVESLRKTVERLETRLDAVEGAQGRQTMMVPKALPPSPVVAQSSRPAAQTTSEALGLASSQLPARHSVSDPGEGASRVDNAPPPTDPDLKGFIDIPGTQTRIRLGGYAKLDAIADNRNAGNDEQFQPKAFPVGSDTRDHAHFNMHARQTRFSFEARRPTEYGSLRFYLENDFYGGDANTYQFRVRHAYGQIGNTYAGFGYSTFMDADALPDTLDFAGPGGQVSVRQAGIHQAFPFGNGNSVTIAGERPQTEVASRTPIQGLTGATRLPDLVVAVRRERAWGHLQASALLRRLGYVAGRADDTTNGWGAALSGAIATFGSDLAMFSAVYGKGIARYLPDTAGSGLDAAVDESGRIHPLTTWGWYGAYTHYWTSQWRSNLVYGQAHVQERDQLATDSFHLSDYAAANLIWSPAPTWTMGVELLHGKLEQHDGERTNDTRLQGSLKYSFIK